MGHTMSSSSFRQHLSLSENQAISARLVGQQAPRPQSCSMDMNNHACSLYRCLELELRPSCFQGKHSHLLSHHPGLVCPLFIFFSFLLPSFPPSLPSCLIFIFTEDQLLSSGFLAVSIQCSLAFFAAFWVFRGYLTIRSTVKSTGDRVHMRERIKTFVHKNDC